MAELGTPKPKPTRCFLQDCPHTAAYTPVYLVPHVKSAEMSRVEMGVGVCRWHRKEWAHCSPDLMDPENQARLRNGLDIAARGEPLWDKAQHLLVQHRKVKVGR